MVLCLISFLLLIFRLVYPSFISKDEKIVVENLPLIEKSLTENAEDSSNPKKENGKILSLFAFDPNTVTEAQLKQLGLKEKTVSTFIKFRNKGFVFKKKDDLKKVYGIGESQFKMLEPYILIEKEKKENEKIQASEISKSEKKENAPRSKIIIELNNADSAALVSLPGIGPGFARKIIKYRNLLGGYANPEQLKEVYGFTEEMYAKLNGLIMLRLPLVLRKINLNADDFKTVNRHPYLEYETTRNIFNLRNSKKIDANDVKKILNNDALYNKLEPYLEY